MKSLKMKLVLFVLAISFIITIITSIVGLTSTTRVGSDTLKEMVTPLANQTAEAIASEISFYTRTVELCTGNPIIRNPDSSEVQFQYQMSSIGPNLQCSSYTIFDKNDKQYVSLADDSSIDLTQMDFYKRSKSEKIMTVSDPITLNNDRSYFAIAAPIININSDEPLYMFTAYYTFDKINSVVDEITFGETGRGYLINKQGLTVSDKITDNVTNGFNAIEAAKSDKKYTQLAKIYNTAFTVNSGSDIINLEGKSQVVGHASVPNTDWILIITAPKNEFLTTIKSTIILLIACSLAVLLLSSVVTYFTVKNIVLPIITTTKRLKELSEGNLTDPVEISNQKNEIGILSSSLEETVFSLKQYIDKISDALNNIADGNLSFEMTGNFRGDFVKIKTSFNSILSSLRDTFGNISNAAEQVNNGAGQVSNGAQALSQGAAQQASSIDLLSTQLTDISLQVNSNADAATKTDELVDNITDEISSCNEEMSRMLTSMDDINKSSNEISKIIKVIDDIAFQTNILALNAAVEAARAGNAGRGFAVVADEVRNLAAKSAEAAKQTTSLIEGSVSNVKKGTKIAKNTASVLDNIVNGASQISRQVKSITTASQDQAESVDRINSSVSEISAVVQTNTATAEESAAASEELSSQSNLLKEMIGKFKFDGNFENDEDNFSDFADYGASPAAVDFSTAQTNQVFDFGEPLSDDKPFNFDEPAEDKSLQSSESEKTFNFDEPAKPFDFDPPQNDTPFEFDSPSKPFSFDAPSKIDLDDDQSNDDDGKY